MQTKRPSVGVGCRIEDRRLRRNLCHKRHSEKPQGQQKQQPHCAFMLPRLQALGQDKKDELHTRAFVPDRTKTKRPGLWPERSGENQK
jgi:hypothetical protein